MSRAPAATMSSNFHIIFVAALRAYEKTKTDLLAHPLAMQLQYCISSSDVHNIFLYIYLKSHPSHNRETVDSRRPPVRWSYPCQGKIGEDIPHSGVRGGGQHARSQARTQVQEWQKTPENLGLCASVRCCEEIGGCCYEGTLKISAGAARAPEKKHLQHDVLGTSGFFNEEIEEVLPRV
ncbi:hypothetical protein EDB87DRAFT_1340770 [Lactarius vividus]|nr:hypothetical protein EDB87DRAFT_1340770 [Lactarius vividus]